MPGYAANPLWIQKLFELLAHLLHASQVFCCNRANCWSSTSTVAIMGKGSRRGFPAKPGLVSNSLANVIYIILCFFFFFVLLLGMHCSWMLVAHVCVVVMLFCRRVHCSICLIPFPLAKFLYCIPFQLCFCFILYLHICTKLLLLLLCHCCISLGC